jgi:hypothetical protein
VYQINAAIVRQQYYKHVPLEVNKDSERGTIGHGVFYAVHAEVVVYQRPTGQTSQSIQSEVRISS